MYSRLQITLKYLHYYLTASNGKGHGIHSPFVFDFITKVLNDKNHYEAYDRVETLRKKLLERQKAVFIDDFGAGSALSPGKERTIAAIAASAAKPKKYGQLLYRMVQYYQPETILELGTSLGITTSYLSFAQPGARLITMEGAKEIAAVAQWNFNELGLTGIQLTEGNFDDTLSSVVSDLSSVNFAFIDGNHQRSPTEHYFQQLLSKAQNDSILVFDDIHWSGEMEAAWNNIKAHTSVRCSIDLFFIGIVFFRNEFKEPVHFTIRF